MFCPQCGQQQVSSETRFCSRCGFLLIGVTDLIARGGGSPDQPDKAISPRKRGLKQGLFIFLLTFLFAPLTGMLSMWIGARPTAVGVVTVIFFMGGLLRMVYALMFESSNIGGSTLEQHVQGATQNLLNRPSPAALPAQQSIPASDYVSPASGNWRETNELVAPGSVTDNTTKLLERSEDQ